VLSVLPDEPYRRSQVRVEPTGDTLNAGNRGDAILSSALVTVFAVGTGVVVIVVAIAAVILVVTVTASMRGRQKRRAQRTDATRRDLGEANERAERAERDRDIAQEQAERRTDPDR
jgi:hypothetical protein